MSINNIALKAARAAYEYADRHDLEDILLHDLAEAANAADAAGVGGLAAALRSAAAEKPPQRRGEAAVIAAITAIEESLLRLQQGL
jgi:hypothetical protein